MTGDDDYPRELQDRKEKIFELGQKRLVALDKLENEKQKKQKLMKKVEQKIKKGLLEGNHLKKTLHDGTETDLEPHDPKDQIVYKQEIVDTITRHLTTLTDPEDVKKYQNLAKGNEKDLSRMKGNGVAKIEKEIDDDVPPTLAEFMTNQCNKNLKRVESIPHRELLRYMIALESMTFQDPAHRPVPGKLLAYLQTLDPDTYLLASGLVGLVGL